MAIVKNENHKGHAGKQSRPRETTVARRLRSARRENCLDEHGNRDYCTWRDAKITETVLIQKKLV